MFVFKTTQLAYRKMFVAAAALTLAASTIGCSYNRQAVGQDNGALGSNLYLPSAYTAVPPTRGLERTLIVLEPQAPSSVNQHLYPPIAR